MAKIYDGTLLLIEILFLILKVFYFICESIFTMFIPITKKSVAGEIILVRGIHRICIDKEAIFSILIYSIYKINICKYINKFILSKHYFL